MVLVDTANFTFHRETSNCDFSQYEGGYESCELTNGDLAYHTLVQEREVKVDDFEKSYWKFRPEERDLDGNMFQSCHRRPDQAA